MLKAGVATTLGVLMMVAAPTPLLRAADPPRRKPLDSSQRAAVMTLLGAVDAAQERHPDDGAEDPPSDHVTWHSHILKSRDHTAYVPFRLTLAGGAAKEMKSAAMYVRVVSRRDGIGATEQHSKLRDWLIRGGDALPVAQQTVFIGPGEMPVGGPATSSPRQSTQAPAEASAILSLRQRELERQKAAEEAARKKAERDPSVFPFEEYYFVDLKSASIERALSLPPGQFDVYVAFVDRARSRPAEPAIITRTIAIPDFWDDRLGLSSLMLVTGVNTLSAPLPALQQVERPYAFGRAEVVPVRTTTFSPNDALSVVFQVFNYGAPDADLAIEYNFFHQSEGARRLFNRTPTQELTDDDLPSVSPWDTQAFISQAVSLRTFPPGQYELEVSVRDRRTRGTAKQSVTFSVQ